MRRYHTALYDPWVGRHVSVLCYGHYGPPVLVFPSSRGTFHEFEDNGMVGALAWLLQKGRLKLYCPESLDGESWCNYDASNEHRAGRHRAYEHFIVRTLVPFIRWDCGNDDQRIGVTGCSFGAYHSANFALKFPHLFHYALCMSGAYDIASTMFDGWSNDDVFFNNPMGFGYHLHGGPLEHVRRNTHLVLVCGQGAWEPPFLGSTHAFAGLLRWKGISHELDIWGHDVEHHWYWWRRQIAVHFGRALD